MKPLEMKTLPAAVIVLTSLACRAQTAIAPDPAAAGHKLAGIPWTSHFRENIKSITIRWIAADRQGALEWLTKKEDVPASLRAELGEMASR